MSSPASPISTLVSAPPPPAPARPDLVVLTNVPTPYRLALHHRIEVEMPEVRLVTLYTHDVADQGWKLEAGASEVVRFGQGDSVHDSSKPGRALHEWRKGGRIIEWFKARLSKFSPPAGLMLCGYNDPARLRVLRWATANRIPTFLVGDSNIHGESVSGLKAIVKKALVGWVINRCDGVMPCGTFGEQFFVKYGARPERVFYVPYEPDYALIENLPREAIDATAAKWRLDPARKRIVFCSRMIDVKRPAMAVDAFAAIARDRPDFDLIMIGDGPLKAATEASVPADLRSRVTFTGFIGSQPEISAIYRLSHIFLHPSVYEPWGVVINESVCAGMAVVSASTVGAAGELVADNVNGLLFLPDDAASMAAALRSATDAATLARLLAGAPGVLADWRHRGDPVNGIRRALASVPPR